jgi:uncharacterized membrane protein YeaQ/YmgE (transglycosylase-associated protein family)
MWPTALVVDDPFSAHLLRMLGVVVIAAVLGWTAARCMDPGVRARGISLLAGLVGLTAGTWVAGFAGWDPGPTILGYTLLPSFIGSLAIVRLLTLSVTSSR